MHLISVLTSLSCRTFWNSSKIGHFKSLNYSQFTDEADNGEMGAQLENPSPVKPAHQDLVYKGPFVGRARVTKDYTPSPYDKESLTLKVSLTY